EQTCERDGDWACAGTVTSSGRNGSDAAIGVCLSDSGGELGVKVARQAILEPPREGDRSLALVRHIRRRSEAPKRSISCAEAGEEHNVRTVDCLVDVAPACVTRLRGLGLALPMDELGTDRIVAVPSCGRERTRRFVERECEQIATAVLVPPHA